MRDAVNALCGRSREKERSGIIGTRDDTDADDIATATAQKSRPTAEAANKSTGWQQDGMMPCNSMGSSRKAGHLQPSILNPQVAVHYSIPADL